MSFWSSFLVSKLPLMLGLKTKTGPTIESVDFTASDRPSFRITGIDGNSYDITGMDRKLYTITGKDS